MTDASPGHRCNTAGLDTEGDWPLGRLTGLVGVGVPLALWVRGRSSLAELTNLAVTVTGARASTECGNTVAGDVSYELARAGVTVLSGGSLGVDEAAHRGALAANGRTIVVLANGVDRTHPHQHARLYQAVIEQGGLLVSEYPIGTRPTRIRFHARCRLLAALSSATLIVEAGQRSGALFRRPSRWRARPSGLRRTGTDPLRDVEGRPRAAAHRCRHRGQLGQAHQLPGENAMSGHDAFRAALAALDLPPEWQVEVAIRPRRRKTGIQVNPGVGVAVLIPPTAAPEQVARFVGSHRRWITEKVDTATRLAPDHAIKEFVDGEEFDLLGRRYRLQFVDASPAGAAQLPLITSDGVLSARRQRPELVRRAVIGLYQQVGLAWLRREGRKYELDGHITGLSYAVRDLGRRRWGIYEGPPKHTTTLHWAVFGLPLRLIE